MTADLETATVTDEWPGAYAPGDIRNGVQNRTSEAVTDARPVSYPTRPVPVACSECGQNIPPDKWTIVVRALVSRREPHYCWTCANASSIRDYLLPWTTDSARNYGRDDPIYYTRVCPQCGRHFIGHIARRYCSELCGELTRAARRDRTRDRQSRPCQTCGDPFTPPRDDGRYCSPACRQKAYRQRKAAEEAT